MCGVPVCMHRISLCIRPLLRSAQALSRAATALHTHALSKACNYRPAGYPALSTVPPLQVAQRWLKCLLAGLLALLWLIEQIVKFVNRRARRACHPRPCSKPIWWRPTLASGRPRPHCGCTVAVWDNASGLTAALVMP